MNITFPELAGRASPTVIYDPNTAGVPTTTPSLTANLVCRVLLAIIGNLVCLVPLRLLHRNGEFAVTVFIANLELQNIQATANTLIWRNDDVQSWWHGQGFCDVVPYLHNFFTGVYGTSMLAIMRNLAQQVGLLRASPLTVQEKRRKNLVQALIIFPIPVLQVAMTWPLADHRYDIGTFVGCTWSAHSSWPLFLFYIIPPVVLALLTAVYAVLTFIRYRQATRSTQAALGGSNRLVHVRAQRTRRRLYLMVLSILIPYLPVVIALAVLNFLAFPELLPFDVHAIHNPPFPDSWNSVLLLTSKDVLAGPLNEAWIPILTAIPIFLFFGMTKEALNDYRRVLVFLQLGKIFPRLNEEYDPDRAVYASGSLGSSTANSSSGNSRHKLRSYISPKKLETLFSLHSRRSSSVEVPLSQPLDFVTTTELGHDLEASPSPGGGTASGSHPFHVQRPQDPTQPLPHPNLSASTELPPRNPFLFRTTLDFPFPFFRLPRLSSFRRPKPPPDSDSTLPLHSLPSPPAAVLSTTSENWCDVEDTQKVETKVWSQEQHGGTGDEAEVNRGVVIRTMLTRESNMASEQRP